MELFRNTKIVRLKSVHNKYLTAEEDEQSVTQSRDGSSRNAKWMIEFVENTDNKIIRLKSCYNKYLTASNHAFLLGMTGRKATQTVPKLLDSSVEWEPVREGAGAGRVKLKTRFGQFLRGNGGLPPWRNSVTHDVPHTTVTKDWLLWDVHVMEIIENNSPMAKAPPPLVSNSDSFASDSSSTSSSSFSSKSNSFSRQEIRDSLISSPPKAGEGRVIYFHIGDEFGRYDEGEEELGISFKGNDVEELNNRLKELIGVDNVVVYTKSPLNGKLYPLLLQLPPNNSTMHLIVLPSSSIGAEEFS